MLQVEHSAILSTFIKLPYVIKDIKNFILSIFEWPLKTGFTVHQFDSDWIAMGLQWQFNVNDQDLMFLEGSLLRMVVLVRYVNKK